MDFSIKVDIIKMGWPIVYIEGLQVILSKIVFSFSEDRVCLSKQYSPK